MSNCLPAGASINDWNYAGKLWNITYVVDSIEKIEQQFTLSSILL